VGSSLRPRCRSPYAAVELLEPVTIEPVCLRRFPLPAAAGNSFGYTVCLQSSPFQFFIASFILSKSITFGIALSKIFRLH
jgi:hypothetical protein